MFIFGQTLLDTTVVYDPVLDTYTPKAPMPYPSVEGCGAVAGDGTMVVIGGSGAGSPQNRVRRYDPVLDTWSVSVNPVAVDDCAAATGPDGRIHVTGRSIPATMNHFIYDAVLDTWTTAGPSLRPRWQHGSSFVDGNLFVYGGVGDGFLAWPPQPWASGFYLDMWDASLAVWSSGPDLPGRFRRFGSVDDGSRIYVIGNELGAGISDRILEYDILGQYWTFSPHTLVYPMQEPCAAITNGAIHVFGGAPGGTLHQILGLQPHCGNGSVENGEDCDDAGESTSCDADCSLAVCGDGQLNATAGEVCDEMGSTSTCDADCTAVVCGDGFANAAAGEVCDEGGASAACDDDCTPAACGDGLPNPLAGEECDEGGASVTCDHDCTAVACGDGTVNLLAGEVCDDGEATVSCDDDCTPATCGDGHVNTAAGETCDDGGPSASCNEDCTLRSCGDGVWNAAAGEVCDHGGETATCDADCTEVLCGDGHVNAAAGEACDGAGWSADCDADCSWADCGDGQLNEAAGETCDDGNQRDGDGCDAGCHEEAGGAGGGEPAPEPLPEPMPEVREGGCSCSQGPAEPERAPSWAWWAAVAAWGARRRRSKKLACAMVAIVVAMLASPGEAWAQPLDWLNAPYGVLPEPRAEHTAVTGLDGRIYIFGGYADSPTVRTATATSYVYDPATQVTAPIAPMPFATRGHCSAVAADGRIVSFGGYDGGQLSTTQIYEPLMDAWTLGTSSIRGWGCAAAVDDAGFIHVTGGESARNKYQLFDPVLGTFTAMPNLPVDRYGHGSVFVAGALLVLGGRDSLTGPGVFDTVLGFDAGTSTWSTVSNLPASRTRAATVLHGTQIFVLGGLDASFNPTSTFFYSNDAAQTWSEVPSSHLPPWTVANAAAASTPGILFWIGGQMSAGPVATMRNAVLATFCGNGIAEAGEDCDEGPLSPTCDVDCTAVLCGDGTVNTAAGEDCDTQGNSASCDADCTVPMCGDGFHNPVFGESCDDGGESATCDVDCTPALCGDLTTNAAAGETCDEGGETLTCNVDCTMAACGDGVTNTTAGETCDDEGESPTCDEDCTPVECGDGVVNVLAGETCDEGFESATCNANCTLRSCGDGVVNGTAGEQCDDGAESATCDADCTYPICGDGVANTLAGEACDDKFATAACDADCTLAECGDGTFNPAAEECDDGNLDDGDGCDASCEVETGPPGAGSGGAATTSSSTGGSEAFEPEGGCTCTQGRSSGDSPLAMIVQALVLCGAYRRRRRFA